MNNSLNTNNNNNNNNNNNSNNNNNNNNDNHSGDNSNSSNTDSNDDDKEKRERKDQKEENASSEEMNYEDIYEKKKKERMLEEERGENEKRRLEELMRMMEGSVHSIDVVDSAPGASANDVVSRDSAGKEAKSLSSADEIVLPKYSMMSQGGEMHGRAGDAVNQDARVVDPAPATEGERRREGAGYDTYLNALSDFNEKFFKLKETSFPLQEDDRNYADPSKRHFDEKSYVIPSSNQANPQLASLTPQHTSRDTPASQQAPPRQGASRHKREDSDDDDDAIGASPIPDSGVEFCSPDWGQFSQPFQHKTPEKKFSLSKKVPHHSSYHTQLSPFTPPPPSSFSSTFTKPSSLQQRHYHLSTPRIIQSSMRTTANSSCSEDGRHLSSLSNPHLFGTTHSRQQPSFSSSSATSTYRPSYSRFSPMNDVRISRFGSDSKILRAERWDESQQELHILRELQRDVVLNIEHLQRDISQTEAQQSEALRELEVERALLGGERRLLVGEVDALRERLRHIDAKLKQLCKKVHKDHNELKAEKVKLKELEARRKAIEARMDGRIDSKKGEKTNKGVEEGVKEGKEEGRKGGEELEGQWRDAKEEEDAQRALVENIEFQLLEGESREEEEREKEEDKVILERKRLLDLLASKQLELDEMASQETEMVRQVARDGEDLSERCRLLGQQLDKERSILDNINQQTDLLLSFSSSSSSMHPHKFSYQALNRRNENLSKSTSPQHHPLLHHHHQHQQQQQPLNPSSMHYPYLKKTASQTLPLLESYKNPSGLQRDRIAFLKTFEERSFRYQLKPKASNPALYPSTDWSKHSSGRDLKQKAASWLAVNSDSEETLSGSESEKDVSEWSKDEALERIRDMECQLLIAKAEKMKLVDRQKKELESMQGEMRRRRGESVDGRGDRVVLRRGAEEKKEVVRASDVLSVTSQLQSRPLTRYLPTHDRSLDLASFITSCGHNVQQCRNVILTASSCRGYLNKMTGCHIRKWKKRWFVFDRSKRSLSYFADNREAKPKAVVYFQSIEDVFVDHLHQVSSPTPQLTFCLKTLQRAFFLLAPSADAMRVWIDVLSTGAEAHHRFT